jgi:isochorismate hydrolase
MKEAYFTSENILGKSKDMLSDINGMRRKRPLVQDQAALLVLDMQRYFLQGASHAFVPSAGAIVGGINRLIRAFTHHRRPVIATRHVNTPQDAGQMSVWWRELLTAENPLSRLSDELDGDGALCLDKSQYDAFHDTRLMEMLTERDVKQVVICGVMTHLCCETTARSAFMRGFDVFFAVDGTATYNEAFHRAALLNLSHGFAAPALIDDIIADMRP